MPLQSSPVGSVVRTYGDLNPVMHQVTQQAVHRALAVELVEDEPHHRLDLLVRIDGRLAAGQREVANGRRAKQLAAASLVEPALVHPLLEDVQLGLADRSLNAQQKLCSVVGRSIQAVGVGQERAEAGAQFQELMPVLAGAGQAAHLQAEDQADVIQSDLGQQSLEAEAALGGLAAEAGVVVDDGNVVGWAGQSGRAIHECILTSGGLLMPEDLLGRGLADVDEGGTVAMPGPDFRRREGVIHGRPPCGAGPDEAGRGVVRAGRAVAAAGSMAGGSKAAVSPGWLTVEWASGAGGKWTSLGGRHAAPPVVSSRRCRHQTASSSNADTRIVARIGDATPPLA